MPKSFHNYYEYENIIDDLLELEYKDPARINAKIFCDNLVVMWCGKYVTYGRLIPNKKKTKKCYSAAFLGLREGGSVYSLNRPNSLLSSNVKSSLYKPL